jgi:hypothetical protein
MPDASLAKSALDFPIFHATIHPDERMEFILPIRIGETVRAGLEAASRVKLDPSAAPFDQQPNTRQTTVSKQLTPTGN